MNKRKKFGTGASLIARRIRENPSNIRESMVFTMKDGLKYLSTLEKSGVAVVDKNSTDPLKWLVSRGPRWYDVAYQWMIPACIGLNKPITSNYARRETNKIASDAKSKMASVKQAIIAEAESITDGKNDWEDLKNLVRQMRDLKVKSEMTTTVPIVVVFDDGVEIETNAKYTNHAMNMAREEYKRRYGKDGTIKFVDH